MFNSKQREIDRLNARCIELSRQLRDSNRENKELKELRLEAVANNTKLLQVNTEQSKILSEIYKLATQNTYGNPKINLGRIKELSKNFEAHR